MTSPRLRLPAWTPPPARIAPPWRDDPSTALARHFRELRAPRMAGLPFVNDALEVEVGAMRRTAGDWLGTLVTPWSVQLVLLPGGGALWADTPAGCRRAVALPVGTLDFIADGPDASDRHADAGDELLVAWQYCPLANAVDRFAHHAAARAFAIEALEAALTDPAAPPQSPSEAGSPAASLASEPPPRLAGEVDLRRRGLLGFGRGRPQR